MRRRKPRRIVAEAASSGPSRDSWPEEIVSVEAVAVERYPDLE
jgi:hypothetical protein